jgi:plasmid stability protein
MSHLSAKARFTYRRYHDINSVMAQLIVRKLEHEVKDKLRRRARRHGRSVEEEVREILRDATKHEGQGSRRLGTEIAQLFLRSGLKPGEEIPELRDFEIQPPDFDA